MVSINYTLIAQIVNFIILLWVLAKFAYKPLLKAMDDRRAKIVKDMDQADHARKDAEALKEQYAEQLKSARKEANDIVSRANTMAQQLHDEALANAQKERAELLASGRQTVEMEKRKALLEVRGADHCFKYGNCLPGTAGQAGFCRRPGTGGQGSPMPPLAEQQQKSDWKDPGKRDRGGRINR